MVSVEYYLRAFQQVFPKRIEEFRQLLVSKKQIDEKFLRTKELTEEDRENILGIIGKDTFFKKGEARKKTIRHHIFKIIKSLRFFEDSKEEILNTLNKSKIVGKTVIARGAIKEIEKLSDSMLHNLKKLSEIYEYEAYSISNRDNERYEDLLVSSQKFSNNIASFKPKCTSIIKSLNYLWLSTFSKPLKQDMSKSSYEQEIAMRAFYSAIGAVILCCIQIGIAGGVILSYLNQINPPQTELQNILNLLISIGGGAAAAWSVPILSETLKATINSLSGD